MATILPEQNATEMANALSTGMFRSRTSPDGSAGRGSFTFSGCKSIGDSEQSQKYLALYIAGACNSLKKHTLLRSIRGVNHYY